MRDRIGYVTICEADTYVARHYISTDPKRQMWDALAEDDKAALLRRSFEAIETLPFTGRRFDLNQSTAFPRWPDEEIPTAILSAQIENAFELNVNEKSDENGLYKTMWEYGITEYKIGNLYERMGSGFGFSDAMLRNGLSSAKVLTVLQPYLSGTYRLGGIR